VAASNKYRQRLTFELAQSFLKRREHDKGFKQWQM
jgi:hypothetical protein